MRHLVVTVGQSDLQVAWERDGARTLHKIEKDSVRAFHDALLSGEVPHSVIPFGETASWTEKRPLLRFNRDSKTLGPLPAAGEIDARSGVLLAAPLFSKLLTHERIRNLSFESVLILDTCRDSAPGEPVAVFNVLRAPVAAALNIEPSRVSRVSFLIGGETQDEEDESGQKFLLPAAARRIDSAIRDLPSGQGDGKKTLFIADAGGLPSVKPVLEASARLRADLVRFVAPVEEGPANRPVRSFIAIGPAESLHVRRLARLMILRGGFAEAAAMVAVESATDRKLAEKQEPWRASLRHAAGMLRGEAPGTAKPGRVSPLLAKIHKLGPLAWTAFRVEGGLRSGDIREALCAQFTFGDIAARLIHNKLRNQDPPPMVPAWELPDLWPDGEAKKAYGIFRELSSMLRSLRNTIIHGWANEKQVRESVAVYHRHGLWRRDPPSFLSQAPGADLLKILTGDSVSVAKLYQDLVDALLSDMDEFSLLDAPRA